ncbi:hypothetical protein [Streptomyces sp. NPDC089919]|uniref:hypothetical protein n=1 Tax=Streptomyces sp. NPDC089919 TaxID=3155188 RepID=UPI00342662E3
MRRSAGRRSGIAAAVLCGALALTACGGGGQDAAGQVVGGATPSPVATPAGSTASSTPPAGAGAEPTAAATPKSGPSATAAPGSGSGAKGSAKPTKAPGAPKPAGSPDCDHKMPISPDEIAVERYTPEGGELNLIVHLGNWDCPDPNTDGAAFAPMGREIDMPLNQAAYITAVNPIVESTENQRIGVQELLDWLEAHPDAGLVFKYHLGKDGAIDSLEQEFTP